MDQLELPLKSSDMLPCSFADDAYRAALKIIDMRGQDALIYVALRQFDDFQDEIDQAYWVEVRRACKYLMASHGFWCEGHHRRLPMK